MRSDIEIEKGETKKKQRFNPEPNNNPRSLEGKRRSGCTKEEIV